MSPAEVVRKWADAANRHDAAAVASLYAPNAVVRDPSYAEPLEGTDNIERDMSDFLRAFPDLRFNVEEMIETGTTGASEVTVSGTHTGPLVTDSTEIPPTGRSMEFRGAGFYRLDGQGRILEEHRYYDLAGLFAQLGVTV